MRGEGREKMWRFIRMASADEFVEARGLVSAHAIHASIAYRVIDRRDAVAGLDRSSSPVGFDTLAERHHASAHLMTRHGPVAAAEFTAPHVDLGATHVRLSHIEDKTSCGRRGNFIFVKFDF